MLQAALGTPGRVASAVVVLDRLAQLARQGAELQTLDAERKQAEAQPRGEDNSGDVQES